MKAENRNEELVLAHFEARATPDQKRAAEAAGKTPAGAMKYARKQAEKLPRVGGCVAVDDATVFGWTWRYFTDGKTETAPQPNRTAERVPAARKNADGCVQLELFGGLDA